MLERLTGIKDKVINWISCGSFGLSLICLCIGLDKLFRYKNGDVYPYDLHNAPKNLIYGLHKQSGHNKICRKQGQDQKAFVF